MNRQDNLAETYETLSDLMRDRVFQNHIAQVHADAIHAELSKIHLPSPSTIVPNASRSIAASSPWRADAY